MSEQELHSPQPTKSPYSGAYNIPIPPIPAPESEPNSPELPYLAYVQPFSTSAGNSGAGQQQQQFKSSFAPSNKAAERKAKAQAQQAAQQAAAHKPGRAQGVRKKGTRPTSGTSGAWGESSEEEDDDDDEDDDDVDSDGPAMGQLGVPQVGQRVASPGANPQAMGPDGYPTQQGMHTRPPRTLPQIPGQREYCECVFPIRFLQVFRFGVQA